MLINTQLFSSEAQHFKRYGYYCPDPPGTLAHYEYWSEQLRRCKEGYSVGGMRITGHHYNYLNFTQIRLKDDTPEGRKEKKKRRSRHKVVDFPSFWDGDYNYFWAADIAHFGIDEQSLEQLNLDYVPLWLDGGHHLVVVKARRKGFSYKNSSMAANIYNTIRNSYVMLCAYDSKYLYPDGIMSMASKNLDFYNKYTAWSKRRQAINKKEHKRSSYFKILDGSGAKVEEGYMSEIRAISFKDNPDAGRGKDADLVIFEEGGAFDNFLASMRAIRPAVEEDGEATGLMIAFGTGGDMEGGTIDLEQLFYGPEAENFMPFDNVWDEGASGTTCGFFFADWQNKKPFMDEHGNTKKEEALEASRKKREQIEQNSRTEDTITSYKTEYPDQPKESFARTTGNIFPVAALNDWKNQILRNDKLMNIGVHGKLVPTAEGIRFTPDPNAKPLLDFPIRRGVSHDGCVTVYQPPYRDSNNQTPFGLYIIMHDPYAFDKSTNSTSAGAAYVVKLPNKFSKPDDMIVASYIARPATQDDYNEVLFNLARYYNAQIAFENDRGDVIGYAKRMKMLHYLIEETDFVDKKNNVNFRALSRSYGMSVGTGPRKGQAEIYLRDWLKTPRGIDEDGNHRLNLHMIYDIGLLRELVLYADGMNADRISALRVGMFYLQDHVSRVLAAEEEEGDDAFDEFFNRTLYR